MRLIGKYQVLGLLGRGGMGAVYKARMPVTGKIVALKLLSPTPFLETLVGAAEIERRFLAEAATLGGLNHPHVAQVWDFGREQERGRPYFTMEYYCRDLGQVLGESADSEAPTRRLPLPRAAGYALQALDGLARLHAADVVHRDVKPSNLLITGEDSIKITDFGLSRVRGESLTASPGLKVGSPFYAAPEQEADPDQAGPRADLFSLGVTLYRMLTGMLPEWPLAGDKLPSRLPSRLPGDLDAAWDDFFRRCLAPRPEARHQDADHMACELAALLADWRKRLEHACRLTDAADLPPPCPDQPDRPDRANRADRPDWADWARPRSEPRKVFGRDAREVLGLDELWRPRCFARPRLVAWPGAASARAAAPAGATVLDESTGLVWQTGGSRFPVDWKEAQAFVAELNARAFAGATGWRLPTVAELASVLSPPAEFTGHCLSPVFDADKRLVWSADRRAYTQAWFADTEQGAFSFADTTCLRYGRAVRPA
jgi:serine/threonine-protein kinase